MEKNARGEPVSAEFQRLARALLQADPEQRMRIDQVLDSDWLKDVERLPSGRSTRGTPQNLDQDLLASVVELGFDKQEIERAVISDDAEKLAHAIYHLLAERKRELSAEEGKAIVRRDSAPTLNPVRSMEQKRSWSSNSLISKPKSHGTTREPSTPPPLLRKRGSRERSSLKLIKFD